jgi:hypothetical protein
MKSLMEQLWEKQQGRALVEALQQSCQSSMLMVIVRWDMYIVRSPHGELSYIVLL